MRNVKLDVDEIHSSYYKPKRGMDIHSKLIEIESNIEKCAAELRNIELPSTKGSYYYNQAYNNLKAAMIEINNLRRQLRG